MGLIIDKLGKRNKFVAKHKGKIEFVLDMFWWAVLIGIMVNHRLMLNYECLQYNQSMMRTIICNQSFISDNLTFIRTGG